MREETFTDSFILLQHRSNDNMLMNILYLFTNDVQKLFQEVQFTLRHGNIFVIGKTMLEDRIEVIEITASSLI